MSLDKQVTKHTEKKMRADLEPSDIIKATRDKLGEQKLKRIKKAFQGSADLKEYIMEMMVKYRLIQNQSIDINERAENVAQRVKVNDAIYNELIQMWQELMGEEKEVKEEDTFE